jgi:hypothetical protein
VSRDLHSVHELSILSDELHEAATRGWLLLPLHERGKTPLLRGWQQAATHDLRQIETWRTQYRNCNWGMATGPGSGVFVLDVDGELGAAALRSLQAKGNELPQTLVVSTGNGAHYYFRWPEGQIVRNSTGKLGERLDVRGDGGFVVIPPSIHPNGAPYAYTEQRPIADAPRWLLDRIALPAHAGISVLREGHRNDGLTRYAGACRRKGATHVELERLLLTENLRRCRPPLQHTEVLRIAASIARYPAGGPDPLETAWSRVLCETHPSTYQKFLALTRHLQLARPGFPIALPLERIGALMDRNWTLMRRYRKRAASEGLLREVQRCVPKKLATLFEVPHPDQTGVPLTPNGGTTNSPSSE